MPLSLDQIDAFTHRPFAGNPAAVCLLPEPAGADWMQSVAEEMRLSETAFVSPDGEEWRLRWFTPKCEVQLCGHATLAAAHCLWERGLADRGAAIRFRTIHSGVLVCTREDDRIAMDFPARPAREAEPPTGLLDALGCAATRVARGPYDWLVEVADPAGVRSLNPDFRALRKYDVRGVIVTSRGDGRPYDIVSRFFAPGAGVDEDPVTGSAHCTLAPWWQERIGDRDILAYQASARGGELRIRARGDRVRLSGGAVTITRGHLSESAAHASFGSPA